MKLKDYLIATALCLLTIIAFSHQLSCSSAPKHTSHYSGVYHIVKPGQTLYRISLTYQVPLDTVTRVNGISDPSHISVGQRIFIPGAPKVLYVPILKTPLTGFSVLPAAGPVTSAFGAPRGRSRHTGIDISGTLRSPIRAVMPGVVTFSGWQRDYGTMVIIRHAQGFESVYAHNHSNLVQKGQIVEKGQIIALMGRTGNATGCHVHFELRKNGRPVDPLAYFNR